MCFSQDVEDNSKQAFSQDMSDLSGGSLSAISLHQDDVKCKGEVLEDEAEQPSPVSVLDTSFHDDICSPGGVDVTTLSLTGGCLGGVIAHDMVFFLKQKLKICKPCVTFGPLQMPTSLQGSKLLQMNERARGRNICWRAICLNLNLVGRCLQKLPQI